jgi:hypothetical protein
MLPKNTGHKKHFAHKNNESSRSRARWRTRRSTVINISETVSEIRPIFDIFGDISVHHEVIRKSLSVYYPFSIWRNFGRALADNFKFEATQASTSSKSAKKTCFPLRVPINSLL